MRLPAVIWLTSTTTLMLTGCAGGGSGPGYWFQFILIVIPIFILGYLMINRFDNLNDSIFSLETKLNKLSERLDLLEVDIKKGKVKK